MPNIELFDIENFDSKEEMWFSYYLSELKERGFIKDFIHQPYTFTMTEPYMSNMFVEKRNHNEQKDVKLLNESTYTPDFEITWDKKANGLLYWVQGGVYKRGAYPYSKPRRDYFVPFVANTNGLGQTLSYVDVKGTFGASDRSFSLTQKFMASQGTFVQKIVISLCEKGLFYKTFFPRFVVASEVYKKDYKRKGKLIAKEGDSKIKVDIRLIEKWLKLKQ